MAQKEQKRMKTVRTLTLILLVMSLFLLLGGVTFAVYSKLLKGTTNNIIQAGTLAFSYDESSFQQNGVQIENAFFTPDDIGKRLSGTHEYFDFSVNAQSTLADISYQVLVIKQNQSTLDEGLVKVYVTTKNGQVETSSPLVEKEGRVLTYKDLVSPSDGVGKIVYNGIVLKGDKNYHQDFRLRLWLSNDEEVMESINNKVFSVKVKVVANEVR